MDSFFVAFVLYKEIVKGLYFGNFLVVFVFVWQVHVSHFHSIFSFIGKVFWDCLTYVGIFLHDSSRSAGLEYGMC